MIVILFKILDTIIEHNNNLIERLLYILTILRYNEKFRKID